MKGFWTIFRRNKISTIYKNGKEHYQCYTYKPMSLEQEREFLRITEIYYDALENGVISPLEPPE